MKDLARNFCYAIAPRWTAEFLSARARELSHRLVLQWDGVAVGEKLIEHYGNRVVSGPFEGLELSPMTHAELLGPFLLGIYESELDVAWEIVFQGNYSQLVDIGAKFGFYAVGLAKRFPDASVIAFDTDSWAREALGEMSRVNRTPNVSIKSYCDSKWLRNSLQAGSFVISDCEGYESALFDDRTIATLPTATLLIETHEELVAGIEQRLENAFATSHTVYRLGDISQRRQPPALNFLTKPEIKTAVAPLHPPQVWLLCLPKTGPNSSLIQLAATRLGAQSTSD